MSALPMNSNTSQASPQAVLHRLMAQGVLSDTQSQRVSHSSLRPLIDAGMVPERIFAEITSAVYECAFITREQLPFRAVDETTELASFLIEHEVLPLSLTDGVLAVAMSDPSDELALQVLRAKLKCSVVLGVGVRTEILAALTQFYSTPQLLSSSTGDTEVPDDLDSDSDLVRDLHRLIQRAVSSNASDIHFEPMGATLRVRFRVHGLLRNIQQFDATKREQVIARLKLMSKLDITERRHAQNGRFKFPADGRVVDLRVSTLPLHDGESVVLRLLDVNLSQQPLQSLGFSEAVSEGLHQAIRTQQGLILITGPTGSGKSTTVYSLLNQLNKSDQKLISIEDPVELNIAGINQIQVDEEFGLSFAASLKTVLRQDPDIIMVGEIRDAETAQLAAQAALTGHLVLATLHTSSAASAVTRLQNLGLPDYLISATVRAVLAQRLLRCHCKDCAKKGVNAECLACNGSGYVGRTTIAELLPSSAFNQDMQTCEASLSAHLLGGKTLADDAQRLLDSNTTDHHEVYRVLGVDLKADLEPD
jgi:general secretion pathway protein E